MSYTRLLTEKEIDKYIEIRSTKGDKQAQTYLQSLKLTTEK